MSDNKEKILEKLNVTIVNNDIRNRILFERLNYAFDSLYFRFALVIKELGEYIQKEAIINNDCKRKLANIITFYLENFEEGRK